MLRRWHNIKLWYRHKDWLAIGSNHCRWVPWGYAIRKMKSTWKLICYSWCWTRRGRREMEGRRCCQGLSLFKITWTLANQLLQHSPPDSSSELLMLMKRDWRSSPAPLTWPTTSAYNFARDSPPFADNFARARLQYEMTQHPKILPQLPGTLLELLQTAIESSRYALKLESENADALL